MHFPLNNPVIVSVFKIKLRLTSRAFSALNNLVSIDPYSLILSVQSSRGTQDDQKRGRLEINSITNRLPW